MLNKMITELPEGERPSHMVAVFDKGSKSFRNDLYADYKANRPPAPEDLIPQFPLVRDAADAFGLPVVEKENFEADDIIATIARSAAADGARVVILSSDKDLMQLVDERISLLDPMKGKDISFEQVMEKFGVGPSRVIDVQALAGDSVDNVPGVPGIGIKTAAQLINDFGDLEQLLARADEIKQPKRRQSLIDHADAARISKKLVTLRDDVPLDLDAKDLELKDFDPERALSFCRIMEFRTLTNRIAKKHDVTMPAVPDRPRQADMFGGEDDVQAEAQIGEDPDLNRPVDAGHYEVVFSKERLGPILQKARDQGHICVDTETDALDAVGANLVGVALAVTPGQGYYLPLGHSAKSMERQDRSQMDLAEAQALLAPLLADPSVVKIGQNFKYDLQVLARHGMEVVAYDDTMLMSYVLAAGLHGHGMDLLAERHFGHKTIKFEDVAGKGAKQISFADVPLDQAITYAAEDADITLRLWRKLRAELVRAGKKSVYEHLERPMAGVLAKMESLGVAVDQARLNEISKKLAEIEVAHADRIHHMAGRDFNIGSPKQLGQVLFEEMGLPAPRKTKTGGYQTGSDILEELAAQGHEVAEEVLGWRQTSKLRSTYADALPGFIRPSGRIHTSYSLASTTTGRLSSSDPNLQNIPIRSEAGRQIRTAFVPAEGYVLMSADYSQIELRLLAHIANIPELKQAFHDGIDIHAMTASEVFHVPVEGMDPMIRRQAKAINFGIIYGISAFGLARQLGIGNDEARRFIDAYFAKFPGIRDYMESTKALAREQGYVETIFGRRIHVPSVKEKQPAARAFGERAAINAPIQGAAADIIRRAMIQIDRVIPSMGFDLRMLLQVHDELVFEVPVGLEERAKEEVSKLMAGAALPLVTLSVPLEVECGFGTDWGAAH